MLFCNSKFRSYDTSTNPEKTNTMPSQASAYRGYIRDMKESVAWLAQILMMYALFLSWFFNRWLRGG